MSTEVQHSIPNPLEFFTAGKAIFTVKNNETGNRFTFRVKSAKSQRLLWFVSVLNGPNNSNDYLYIGSIFGLKFTTTTNSKVNRQAMSFKAFDWIWKHVNHYGPLPHYVEVFHEGRCGRCGRKLTVPSSIKRGIGPECVNYVGKPQ